MNYTLNGVADRFPYCTSILMDVQGELGTYAPALWDFDQAESSPRTFVFNCTRYSPISSTQLSLISVTNSTSYNLHSYGTDPTYHNVTNITSFATSNLPINYLLLFDTFYSRVYNLSVFNTSDDVITLLPSYRHNIIQLHFSATNLLSNGPTYINYTLNGNITVEYDLLVLKVTGASDEIIQVYDMNNWPNNLNQVQVFDLDVPESNFIGEVRYISFQSSSSRSADSLQPQRDTQFQITELRLSQTFCADGVTLVGDCTLDTTSGFARVYTPLIPVNATANFGVLQRKSTSPLSFLLSPSI